MFQKLDHIAIAVKNLDSKIQLYEEIFGFSLDNKEEVASEKVKIAYLKLQNEKIELLEPLSLDSPVQKFLEKKGEGLHHLCFEVSNLEESIENLKQKSIQIIEPEIRIGSGGHLVSFLHPKSTGGILIELKETK